MSNSSNQPGYFDPVTFATLVKKYAQIQQKVVDQVRTVASRLSAATPGKFILLQFMMAQVTQIGDTISNCISVINSMINNSIRNQKTS